MSINASAASRAAELNRFDDRVRALLGETVTVSAFHVWIGGSSEAGLRACFTPVED